MLQYPSIDKVIRDTTIYAYDKLDGSNIRAEWRPKSGFSKFGSRRQLIDINTPVLGEAVSLFQDKYTESLNEVFRNARYDKVTVFFEFYGANSFAGNHEEEKHEVTLFDVNVSRKGFLQPKDFNSLLEGIPTAPLLYVGNPNSEFLASVHDGSLPGMTFEGVICKSGYDKKNRLASFKVKNEAWLNKLRGVCGDDEAKFIALA